MKEIKILFFIFILAGITFSGCLKEQGGIYISDVDVMSREQEGKIQLTIIPYIQNTKNTDSNILSLRVKVRDITTQLIAAEKDIDLGYVKSKSQISESVTLSVDSGGEYEVEVILLEDGMDLIHYNTLVTLKSTPGPVQPSDIKLTDMNIVIMQYTDRMSNAVVDVSPGILNQGGDSEPLTMQVTARKDQYSTYIEEDELGIVRSSDSVRGNVRMILPKNNGYTFYVHVIENGNTVVSGEVKQTVELEELRINSPVTYILVEEGKPPKKVHGFGIMIAVFCMCLGYGLIRRTGNKR